MKKSRMVFKLMLLMGVVMACLAASCPTRPVTVCQDVPGDSLLEKWIPDLKLAGTLFKLSVLEVGRLDAVKQKDVAKVLDEADALLTAGTTYDGLFNYLLPKFQWIRDNAGGEVIIIGDYFTNFQGVATPITARDVCYLKYHIADQRKSVLPWIRGMKAQPVGK